MVRQRPHPHLPKPLGGVVHALARETVHDPRVPAMARLQESPQLRPGVVLRHHRVADVGPVEAAHEERGAPQPQPLQDLAPGRPVGGRGERDSRDLGEAIVQRRELQVLGAEVVPPLRHAVRLVDREERQPGARQQLQRAFAQQPLRRHVEKIQPPRRHGRLHFAHLPEGQRGVEARRVHPRLPQRLHLVPHQRDQRRHHHAHALPHHGRDLVAERLAAAGRHEDEAVAPGHRVPDDLLLTPDEVLVPEDAVEDLVDVVGHGWRSSRSWRHGGGRAFCAANRNLSAVGSAIRQDGRDGGFHSADEPSQRGPAPRLNYLGGPAGRSRSNIATCCTPSSSSCTPST